MTIETVTYRLPAYWASALINGDYSGCTDEDEREINAFLAANPGLSAVDCDEPDFSWRNDWNTTGGDVCTYTFLVLTPSAGTI